MKAGAELQLVEFVKRHGITTKGPLSIVLVLTDRARSTELPWTDATLLTGAGGQVAGLSGQAVAGVLKRYGIVRPLSSEGGRTSRGSIEKARAYADLLYSLQNAGLLIVDEVEAWWVDRVKEYFARKPLLLRLNAASGIGTIVRDLLAQARKRQDESPATKVVGTVLQHLVGAKLALAFGDAVEQHGAAVADEGTARAGDFVVGDLVVHVSTSPGQPLIEKCRRNLDSGQRPWIVTTVDGLTSADVFAKDAGIRERIDITDIESFLVSNILERGGCAESERRAFAGAVVNRYNAIVDEHENDPGLRIELQ